MMTPKARRPKARPSAKTWAVRFGVAAVLGALLGAGGGVYAVTRLDPPRAKRVDSLRVMTDSLAARPPRGDWPAPVSTPAGTATADQPLTDTPLTTVAVPSVADLEEGAARSTMIDMGLQVAGVQFQASSRPAGIVLGTIPAAGALVAAQAPITLILSDGRGTPPGGTPPDSSLAESRPLETPRIP